jgi:hypothetical protein
MSSSRTEENTRSTYTRRSIITTLYNNNRDIYHVCNNIKDYNTLRIMINSDDTDWNKYKCKRCSTHIYKYINDLIKSRKLQHFMVEY